MSWDLYIYNWPKDIKTLKDIPDDWDPPPIALRSEIISKIKAAIPQADFSNPSTGKIESDRRILTSDRRFSTLDYSVEVVLGTNDMCYSITLIAGGDQRCVDFVSAIVTNLNVRAFDTGSGDWFKPGADAASGFRQWSEWKERVSATTSKQSVPNALLSPADWILVIIALAAFAVFFTSHWKRSRG